MIFKILYDIVGSPVFADEPAAVREAAEQVAAPMLDYSPLLSLLYRPDGSAGVGPQCAPDTHDARE